MLALNVFHVIRCFHVLDNNVSVFAIGNNKGGPGKTTVTVQLAAALAHGGRRVLVIDLDPQANASRRLGFRWSATEPVATVSEVIKSGEEGIAAEAIVGSSWGDPAGELVDLIPSRWDLEQRISEAGQVGAVRRLARALTGVPVHYDVVLIDLPPSLGHLTHLGLAAADQALCVVEAEYDSVEGATRYRDFITSYRDDLANPDLSLVGVIVSRLRVNLGEHAYQLDGIREQFLDVLWEPSIPERTVLKDAAAAAVPIQSMSGPAAREVATVFEQLAGRLLEQQMKEEIR